MRLLCLLLLALILMGCSTGERVSPPPTTTDQPVTITRYDFPNGG